MEIHFKANLDDKYQLQSVSSTCAQTNGGFAPFGSPVELERVEIKESKFVSYAVKRDLNNKLDAKVTEISQLILELQGTKETLEVLRRLNKEYTEKIERYEDTIKQLQEKNECLSKLLYEHNIPIPENCRSQNMPTLSTVPSQTATLKSQNLAEKSEEQSIVFQSSLTELKFQNRSSSISLTDSLYSKPSKSHDPVDKKEQIDSNGDNDKGDESRHDSLLSRILVSSLSQSSRTNKLNIPKVFNSPCFDKSESKSGTISDKEQRRPNSLSIPTVNEYTDEEPSCMDRDGGQHETTDKDIIPESVSTNDSPPGAVGNWKEQTDDASKDSVKTNPFCPLDDNGYLVLLVPTHSAILQGNFTKCNSDSGHSKPEMEFVTNDSCFCSQCHGDNDVHVSWIDFHKCRNSCSSPIVSGSPEFQDTQRHDSSCGSICSTKSRVAVGPYRRDKELPEHVMNPCLLRSNSVKSTHVGYAEIQGDDEVFDQEESRQRESDSNRDDRYSTRPPPPIPRTSQCHSSSSTSPCTEYGPAKNSAFSQERSKIEDKLNNVMKMMRKTSEWDSAKRLSLEKSLTRTAQDAENTLGVVVKKTVESFQVEMEGKQRRASKNLSDKLIKIVKRSLINKCDHDVITTEFLEKCIQLCDREFS